MLRLGSHLLQMFWLKPLTQHCAPRHAYNIGQQNHHFWCGSIYTGFCVSSDPVPCTQPSQLASSVASHMALAVRQSDIRPRFQSWLVRCFLALSNSAALFRKALDRSVKCFAELIGIGPCPWQNTKNGAVGWIDHRAAVLWTCVRTGPQTNLCRLAGGGGKEIPPGSCSFSNLSLPGKNHMWIKLWMSHLVWLHSWSALGRRLDEVTSQVLSNWNCSVILLQWRWTLTPNYFTPSC